MLAKIFDKGGVMKFELTAINGHEIESYKKFLKQRLNNATHLPFVKVLVSGIEPQANNCHDNAQRYENENSNFECVRGWLVLDGGDSSSEVILLPHSVVKDKREMKFYEITPIDSLEPRPFLESYLTEEDFYSLHEYMMKKMHDVRLIIVK